MSDIAYLLKETASTLTLTWYVDGTPTDVGTVTVDITDPLGNLLVDDGATVNNADGTYTYTVATALTAEVDRWTVKWTEDGGEALTTHAEIVGSWLFTENDARTFSNQAFANTTTYTDAWIADQREQITEDFDQICGVSFVERYGVDRLPGTGDRQLRMSHRRLLRIISATVGGTAQTVADLKILGSGLSADKVWHTAGFWTSATVTDPTNCVVEYAHGFEMPPSRIRRAALIVLRNSVTADVSDRFLSLSSEAGVIRIADPNRNGAWYGIPEVDAILNRYMGRIPFA